MTGRAFSISAALLAVCLTFAFAGAPQARERKRVEKREGATSQAYKPMAIPKPSNRRPGELEGWDDAPGSKQAGKSKGAKAAKSDAASGEKKADTGIPLPQSRTNNDDFGAVGFDRNGNFATGFKF